MHVRHRQLWKPCWLFAYCTDHWLSAALAAVRISAALKGAAELQPPARQLRRHVTALLLKLLLLLVLLLLLLLQPDQLDGLSYDDLAVA
jgi:hypothetical protein